MSKHLPFEIHCEIFAWLDPVDDRPDLLSLCRVSRACKQTAQPILFKAFSTEPSENGLKRLYRPSRILLGRYSDDTRKLLRRIDLRHAIRQLIIKAEDTLKLWDEECGAILPELKTMLLDKMQDSGIEDDSKFEFSKAFFSGEINSILLLLFAYITQLESLSLTFNESRLSGLMYILDPSIARPTVSNLTSLHLSVSPDLEFPEVIYLRDILHLLNLPCLKHFAIDHCVGSSEDVLILGLPPGSANVSSISLIGGCIDEQALTDIIDTCRCLTSLEYVACTGYIEFIEDSIQVNADGLMQALDSQKDNLTSLHVAFNELCEEQNNLVDFGSFVSFKNLRHLHVEQCCLSDTPELPESLQTLVVDSCTSPTFSLVKVLVKESKRSLPNLEKVTVKPLYSFSDWALGDVACWITGNPSRRDPQYSRPLYEQRVRDLEAIADEGDFEFCVEYVQDKECMWEIEDGDEEFLIKSLRAVLLENS